MQGPGAMGCLLAGLLKEAGEDVLLLDRDPGRAAAIAAEGVRIGTGQRTRTIPVPVTAEPGSAGRADLLIVAVKAYDTGQAIRQWKPLVQDGAVVLTLQNGLGNVPVLLEAVPGANLVGGTTAEGATLEGPGHTRHAGSGETVLAAVRGGRKAAEAAAGPLGRAGLDLRVEDDADAVIWAKFLTNVGVNALAGVLGLSNGDLCSREEVHPVIGELIGEATEVARKRGVALLPEDAVARALSVLRRTGDNVNSLLQDLRSGRRTEIDFLNGKVVEEGEALGVATPVNQALWRMVRAMEPKRGVGQDA